MSQAGTNVLKIENDKSILASSRMVWGEGSAPYRVVLRQVGEEYITHMENLRLHDDGVFRHDGFYWGHYHMHLKDAAVADFNERCSKL